MLSPLSYRDTLQTGCPSNSHCSFDLCLPKNFGSTEVTFGPIVSWLFHHESTNSRIFGSLERDFNSFNTSTVSWAWPKQGSNNDPLLCTLVLSPLIYEDTLEVARFLQKLHVKRNYHTFCFVSVPCFIQSSMFQPKRWRWESRLTRCGLPVARLQPEHLILRRSRYSVVVFTCCEIIAF